MVDVHEDDQTVGLTKRSQELLAKLTTYVNNIELDHSTKTIQAIISIINEFETLPNLLDPKLAEYIASLSAVYVSHYSTTSSSNGKTKAIGTIVYNLAKIRGFKVITTYFSSDVYIILTLLELIQTLDIDENEIFLVLLWLCNLVLVPFRFNEDVIYKFYDVGVKQLMKFSNGSKNQICSLMLLSRFLSRRDLAELGFLDRYFTSLVEDWPTLSESNKLGHLMVVNKLLKIAPTELMGDYIDEIYKSMVQYELISLRIQKTNNSNMLYIIKILCKLGEGYVITHNFRVLELIINNLIHDILNYYNESFETNLRYAMAKSLSRITQKLNPVANYQEQLILYLINQLEVEDSDIDFASISISKFHTVLLYLGYSALNKSLPVKLYQLVLTITHQTLFTTLKRFNANIGNQLKDSTCFILWAMIRNKDFKTLPAKTSKGLLLDLIEVALFDDDLIIRRCGVAVLQELMGRVGREIVQTPEESLKGEQILKFIELFSTNKMGSVSDTLHIVDQLIDLGLNKSAIIDMIVRNIRRNDDNFKYQKLLCSKLTEALHMLSKESFDLDITCPEVSISLILLTLKGLKHELFFKSSILISCDIEYHLEPTKYSNELVEDHISVLMLQRVTGNGLDSETFSNVIHCRKDTSEPLIKLFKLSSERGIPLTETEFLDIRRNFSLSLAKSIFYVHTLTETQIQELFDIMHLVHIDYEIRFNLVRCLNINLDHLKINELCIVGLMDLLDDYTTTEQGDVGSKIRDAVLDLAAIHFERVTNLDTRLKQSLCRIAGELIEHLRLKAMKLLLRLHSLSWELDNYYDSLFKFYHSYIHTPEETTQFWKGTILSLGGLTGDYNTIRSSFMKFVEYMEKLSEDDRKTEYREILTVMKRKPKELQKDLKEYIQSLSLMIRVFEANLPFPDEYLQPLYAKAYNLQINTNNISRIKLTIRLMQKLAQQSNIKVRQQCIRRLSSLVQTHKSMIVRQYTLEIIYEFLLDMQDDKHKGLETVDVTATDQVKTVSEYLLCEYM